MDINISCNGRFIDTEDRRDEPSDLHNLVQEKQNLDEKMLIAQQRMVGLEVARDLLKQLSSHLNIVFQNISDLQDAQQNLNQHSKQFDLKFKRYCGGQQSLANRRRSFSNKRKHRFSRRKPFDKQSKKSMNIEAHEQPGRDARHKLQNYSDADDASLSGDSSHSEENRCDDRSFVNQHRNSDQHASLAEDMSKELQPDVHDNTCCDPVSLPGHIGANPGNNGTLLNLSTKQTAVSPLDGNVEREAAKNVQSELSEQDRFLILKNQQQLHQDQHQQQKHKQQQQLKQQEQKQHKQQVLEHRTEHCRLIDNGASAKPGGTLKSPTHISSSSEIKASPCSTTSSTHASSTLASSSTTVSASRDNSLHDTAQVLPDSMVKEEPEVLVVEFNPPDEARKIMEWKAVNKEHDAWMRQEGAPPVYTNYQPAPNQESSLSYSMADNSTALWVEEGRDVFADATMKNVIKNVITNEYVMHRGNIDSKEVRLSIAKTVIEKVGLQNTWQVEEEIMKRITRKMTNQRYHQKEIQEAERIGMSLAEYKDYKRRIKLKAPVNIDCVDVDSQSLPHIQENFDAYQ